MASFQEIITQQLCKIVKLLTSIDNTLKPAGTLRGKKNGWTYTKVGKSWFITTEITYTGSAYSLDLNFSDIITVDAIQLNRIEQNWNDATAKTFSIQMFDNPNTSYYSELYSETSDTSTSIVTQFGIEYPITAGSRLRMYYSSNTNQKTCTIRVQVSEL